MTIQGRNQAGDPSGRRDQHSQGGPLADDATRRRPDTGFPS